MLLCNILINKYLFHSRINVKIFKMPVKRKISTILSEDMIKRNRKSYFKMRSKTQRHVERQILNYIFDKSDLHQLLLDIKTNFTLPS